MAETSLASTPLVTAMYGWVAALSLLVAYASIATIDELFGGFDSLNPLNAMVTVRTDLTGTTSAELRLAGGVASNNLSPSEGGVFLCPRLVCVCSPVSESGIVLTGGSVVKRPSSYALAMLVATSSG